jgi:hypothetical protein
MNMSRQKIKDALMDIGVVELVAEAAVAEHTEIYWQTIYSVCENIVVRNGGDLNVLIFSAVMLMPDTEKNQDTH